jgi:hypothetical protein
MSAIFFLPGLVALYLVVRGRIETAFLAVYLPALLLLPNGYALRIPHLPPISAAQSALIPIGAVAVYRLARRGIPSLLDILVGGFVVSISVSEVLCERVMNDGILSAINTFLSVLLAYAVGRMLIEPGLRLVTVRRIVVLLLLLGPLGLYEWRFGQNLYGVIGMRLFHLTSVQSSVQYRGAHGRMSGPFSDAELAGIVFGIGATLNAWLLYLRKWRANANLGKWLDWLEKYQIPGLLLLLYVYLTQSRGPMLAVGIGYLMVQIPRFKNKKAAMVVAGILIAGACAGAYSYFSHYTNITDSGAILNEQQGSALYRRQMLERYQPIVQRGGWLGQGLLSHPIVPGMFSIDNEYLLVHLAYGHAGYILFLLVGAETMRRLIANSWNLKAREDQGLAIALLGAMLVFWLSISTVYVGEQLPQIAFLVIGWSGSIGASSAVSASAPEDAKRAKYVFRRILK